MMRLRPLLWVGLSALGAVAAVLFVAFALGWIAMPQASEGWVEQPLGLSLRVASKHRPQRGPTPEQAAQLHALGLQARTQVLACIRGVPNPPQTIELVFDDGVVSLASGPVTTETEHGRCVNHVLEGLWGEMSGSHRLVLTLSIP